LRDGRRSAGCEFDAYIRGIMIRVRIAATVQLIPADSVDIGMTPAVHAST
jgi:hypothetical protein